MKARKTISIETLKKLTNSMSRFSTCSPEARQGYQALMNQALHETGNYKGFRYFTQADVGENQLPGINDVDMQTASMHQKFDGTDSSRIYFI